MRTILIKGIGTISYKLTKNKFDDDFIVEGRTYIEGTSTSGWGS